MDNTADTAAHRRRKKKLIKNTLLVALGYFIVLVAIVAARYAGLTGIEPWQIVFCASLSIGGMFIYVIIIAAKKEFSHFAAGFIYVSQFVLWLVLYFFFVLWLREIRLVSLLFAAMALVFVLPNYTFVQSLVMTLTVTLITLAASYIAIYVESQPGDFRMELFFILCFFPSAVYLFYMAGGFLRQRGETYRERRESESTRRSYETHNIDAARLDEYRQRILACMERDRPYLNDALTLKDFARQCDIPPHLVSMTLNMSLNQNFYNFINQHRIEEVKRRLADPQYRDHTLLRIAFDCGFSSKTAFNTMFKKYTGITPSQYRKK